MKILYWLEDQILRALQRKCPHPPHMVAVDVLEGCGAGVEVAYCRRCGAIAPSYEHERVRAADTKRLMGAWRLPDPNLWRD